MRRTGLTFLTSAALLSLAACTAGGDAETRARERCLQGGAQPNSPELQQCIRQTEAWMEQNRALQRRIYTQ